MLLPLLGTACSGFSPTLVVDGREVSRENAASFMEQVEKDAGLGLTRYQPGATCWFGRNENDREYVWCGPVDDELASSSDREVGPPYFRVWEVEEAPGTFSGLALGPPRDFGDDPEGQIDALPFYPTRWWRPDGQTLDPATLRPADAPANR